MGEARYAVLIASSRFPEEPKLQPLNAPECDVDGVAEVLRAPERGAFNDVVVLKNRPYYEVLKELQRLLNRATKQDLVLIYYSGHGKLNRAGELYLTASDTIVAELESSAIAVRELRTFIEVSPVQRIVIILDSCFSGAAGDILLRGDVDSQLQLTSTQGRGTYIMTASTGIQTAQEKETDRYSVFTKHLIAGIETGEADENHDGEITADELYDYIHKRVRQESHQVPTHWGFDMRGHFVIARSGRKLRQKRANELRTVLFRLAGEARIKEETLVHALKIIKQEFDDLSADDQHRDALLGALGENKLDVLDFVIEWSKIDAEAKHKAEEAAKRKAEEAAKRKAEKAAKRKAEKAAKRNAEEAAKRNAEEAAKRNAEEMAKRNAEEAAKRNAEEMAKRNAEEAAKRNAEEAAKRNAEETAKRNAEEAAKREAEEAAKRMREKSNSFDEIVDKAFLKVMLRAAESGDITAQFKLGEMYATGNGVSKNVAEAKKWYHLAVEGGSTLAKTALADL